MKRIVWLASYPKSGNTWLRVFLENLLADSSAPVRINALPEGLLAADRLLLDREIGFSSALLPEQTIRQLRADWYQSLAARPGPDLYLKVHDACDVLDDGRRLFPPDATKAVIYVVRNPLDVCVSFAHHRGHDDLDRVIAELADPSTALAGFPNRFNHQLRQRLGTWTEHVQSWTSSRELNALVIRYEDLRRSPLATFQKLCRHLGLPSDAGRVNRAIRFSRFAEMQRQEQAEGFREQAFAGRRFFRQGEVGSWRKTLSPAQIRRLLTDHGPMMKLLGYLNKDDSPKF